MLWFATFLEIQVTPKGGERAPASRTGSWCHSHPRVAPGKRDTSTPWGSLSTDHWCHCFKTKEHGPIQAYPLLQEMQHLRRQRLAREVHTDHPEGSPSTAQPQGLLQPESAWADPGLPTQQIKTHKPLGQPESWALMKDLCLRLRSMPSREWPGGATPGCQPGDHHHQQANSKNFRTLFL